MGISTAVSQGTSRKLWPGRVIGVFGVPNAGKTSLIGWLQAASKYIVGSISCGDIARSLMTEADKQIMKDGGLFPREDAMRAAIVEQVELFRERGADVILLDGCPRTAEQLQWMFDNQLIGGTRGFLVQITAGSQSILRRSAERSRSDDTVASVHDRIHFQRQQFDGIIRLAQRLRIPYTEIQNEDHQEFQATNRLRQAAKLLA